MDSNSSGGFDANDRHVFTLQVETNGDFTFTLLDQVDHLPNDVPAGDNQTLTIDFSSAIQFTDFDDDTITLSGGFSISIEDDVPVAVNGTVILGKVYEDGLVTAPDVYSEGNPEAGHTAVTATITDAQLANLVMAGADEGLIFSLNGDLSGPSGYFSKGESVDYSVAGGSLTAMAGGRTVFTILDNGNGTYTFTLKDQLDHLPIGSGSGDDETLVINLASAFKATDFDGDSVVLGGSLNLTVENDIPVQLEGIEKGQANEDDLADFNPLYPLIANFWQGSLGTSPFDGPGDQSITGLLGTVPVWGDLSHMVKVGADEKGTFHLVNGTQAEQLLATIGPNGGPLSSHGDVINDARFIDIPNVGEALGFFASDGRLVFGLFVSDNGTYNFRLFDQIDHPLTNDPSTPAQETAFKDILNLDLSEFVQYTDFDGDTITLKPDTFSIDVKDDVPLAIGTETGLVNENDLADFNPLYPLVFDFLQGSLGTSPFDGFTDGGITGLFGTVPVYGFLTDNVIGGADEFGNFDLVSEGSAATLLTTLNNGQPFKSHGDVIDHVESINIPSLGEAMGFFASDGRLVFGLFVSGAGFYNFRLFDQLDHPVGDNPNTGAPEAVADLLNIDLSKFVTFTDNDGDTIDLGSSRFVISVVDDIPMLTGHSVSVTLDEDDLNNFLLGWDLIPSAIKDLFPIEGSAGTSPDADTDALLFNSTGQQGFLNELIGTNTIIGGADEFGHFSLVSQNYADTLLDTVNWTSKGEGIDHTRIVSLGILGDVMGFFAGDRLVFTLTINPTGFYDIRLFDQIDHLGNNGSSISLDLSKFVTYTDFDGDAIDLGVNNLVLTVLDDAPEAVTGTTVFATVEEEQNDFLTALGGGDLTHGNEDLGSVSGDDQDTATNLPGNLVTSNISLFGSIASLVKVGADENGTFSFKNVAGQPVLDSSGQPITSHGFAVKYALQSGQLVGFADADGNGLKGSNEHLVFTVALAEIPPAGLLDGKVNDTFTFTLFDQIDHADPAGGSTEDTKNIDLSGTIQFTDADGDSIDLAAGSFQIKVVDDTPIQVANKTVRGTVEEEHKAGNGFPEMNHGNEDNDAGSAGWRFQFLRGLHRRNDQQGLGRSPLACQRGQ